MVVLGLLVAGVLLGGVFAFRSAFEEAMRKHDRAEAEERAEALREAIDYQIRERVLELESYDPLAVLLDVRAQRAQAAAQQRREEGTETEPEADVPEVSGALLRLQKVVPSRWKRPRQLFLWGTEEGRTSLIRHDRLCPEIVQDPREALAASREGWEGSPAAASTEALAPGSVVPWRRAALRLDGGATAYLVIELVSAVDPQAAAITWVEPLSALLLDLCDGAGFLQDQGFSVLLAPDHGDLREALAADALDGLVTISSWKPGDLPQASPFDRRGFGDDTDHHRTAIAFASVPQRLFLSVPQHQLSTALAGTKDVLTLIGIFLACGASILLYAGGSSVLANKEASRRDPLTGLPNRRTFSAILDDEVSKAARYRRPLSMAVVDLDHFKTINDSLGHRAGDRVLHGAAKLLSETLRRNDHIFRYGGEEFAILMPETDVLAAASALERVRVALENHRIPFGRGTVQVFASFGVTSYVQGESAEDLVVRADSACYAAKSQGRNRVVLLRRDHDAKTEIGLTDMLVRTD